MSETNATTLSRPTHGRPPPRRRPDVGPLDVAVDEFMADAGTTAVVLMNKSGRLLIQRGFDDPRSVIKVATLAAGIHATGRQIGELLGDRRMAQAHNRGDHREFMLSELWTPSGPILFLTVFESGAEARAATVRRAFEVFARRLGALAGMRRAPAATAEEFEASLMESLERLFPALGAGG